jgi:hypothetical protein
LATGTEAFAVSVVLLSGADEVDVGAVRMSREVSLIPWRCDAYSDDERIRRLRGSR